MEEKEFLDLRGFLLSLFFCFILFPALCVFYVIFGYVMVGFIVLEIILSLPTVLFFVQRTVFLLRYKKYNYSKKRFVFETVSYILCFIFAISTAFLVKENDGVFSYYFLNIYIQPAFIIFTFVVMGFMASTAKRVAQIYVAESQKRNPARIHNKSKNQYMGKQDYFEDSSWR